MSTRPPVLPIVAALALVGVAVFTLSRGTPAHLVVVRFDPRLSRTEPPDTPTPRLDALRPKAAQLVWTSRSDVLQAELERLEARLREADWTVLSGNVVDAVLANSAIAKQRGDPGPYFVHLNLAAKDRVATGDAVGRVFDGLAPVLAPAETVFVIVDPSGGTVMAYGPGVEPGTRDPAGDPMRIVEAIEGWID